jgi:LAO/AO transport system kinase
MNAHTRAVSPVARALFDKAIAGDIAAISRLLSSLEADDGLACSLCCLSWIHRRPGTVGFTGPPGAGKSSLVSATIRRLRELGATIAVLAVDPSSPVSGGSILGDRFRMREHTLDPGVYIRSMSSRGASGGLARATADCAAFLSGIYDWVLLESVGVGQGEVDVRTTVDTTVVVLNPGTGDVVQSLKAGILEIADIFVVNKADREGAMVLQADLESLIASVGSRGDWTRPVIPTIATEGFGIKGMVDVLYERRMFIEKPEVVEEHRRTQLTSASAAIFKDELRSSLDEFLLSPEWRKLASALTSPYEGAGEILRWLRSVQPH